MYFKITNKTTPATVNPLYVEQLKATGNTDIALASENIVTVINNKQAIVGVNFEKPSDIFAKLLAAIPVVIPKAKIK